jgi:outer membrane lipoprotein LolB
MRLFSKLCVAICSSSVLVLTGCQHLSQPNKIIASPQVQDENNFSLQGKIGVRTPQQSGSAFFTWVQQQDQFDIELTGILGVGKTQIEGKPGQVTLNSAKTGLITAATPEELLKKQQVGRHRLCICLLGTSEACDAKCSSEQRRTKSLETAH